MFVVLILIANALVSASIASNYVKKNRGQLLEMPDWKLVSDMTMILFMFIFSASLLSAFYFCTGGCWPYYLLGSFVITVCCIFYIAVRNKEIRKVIKNRAKDVIHSRKKRAGENENNTQNSTQEEDHDQNQEEEHDRKFTAAISYAEYTLLYTIWRYLIIFLVESIIYYMLPLFKESSDAAALFLNLCNSGFEVINVLGVVLILEYVGIWIAGIRIIAVMEYVKKRPRRKNLERIKEYLKNEEVKN